MQRAHTVGVKALIANCPGPRSVPG